MIAAPVRTAAATRRTRPGSPAWATGIVPPVGQAPRPRQGLRGALAGMVSLGMELGSLTGAWAPQPMVGALLGP